MKRIILAAAALLVTLAPKAQELTKDTYRQLSVSYSAPQPLFEATDLCSQKLLYPALEGYALGGEHGSPAVPYLSTLVVIPFCDTFSISVTNAVYDTVDLPAQLDLLPAQPPRSKSDTSALVLVRNKEVYSTDAYSGLPLASLLVAGTARDRRLAHLRFAPVSINPVSRRAIVCRKADITVTYYGADSAATVDHYRRYHTPAFSIGSTLNSLGLSSKSTTSPLRLSIILQENLNCRRLQAFADWKRRQGMIVDILTSNRSGSGVRTDLAAELKALYDNATAENPAPTYVLVVGDHEQTPAFNSQLTYSDLRSHVTDLYYTTWTADDYMPDAYCGRFSATDTLTLARIINKTILYESYTFEDDNYLSRAVLVSGIDAGRTSDNAYHYADPSMDYIASQYINADHGYSNVTYYKNRTTYAPAGVTVTGYSGNDTVPAALRRLYDDGIGWVNYSAHGDWDRWHEPAFTTYHANQMKNTGRPSFMIGSCCLSGKFNKSECLGEALLRRGDNAGAVGYIGASQETFWTYDFYWAVGVRSSVSGTSVPTYNSSRLGAYDRLFHTHNEALSAQAATAGQMVYAGNLATQSAGSDQTSKIYAQYYWEIYHFFGDPSLMPWLGKAPELPLSIDTADLATEGSVRLTTVPNAYVAVIDSVTLQVLAVTYTDAVGYGSLTIPLTNLPKGSIFSATAQGYRPYISNLDGVKLGLDIEIHAYPNPATNQVTILGSGISRVDLVDINGHLMSTHEVGADFYTLDIAALQPGFYLAVITTDTGVTTHRIVKK